MKIQCAKRCEAKQHMGHPKRFSFFVVGLGLLMFGCSAHHGAEEGSSSPTSVTLESGTVELGDEYEVFRKDRASGRKTGNGLRTVLLYLPNRVLDLLDIFRLDLGVGPSAGAVVRLTKFGQVGMRTFLPGSLRLGLRGRASPIFLERTNEFGIGTGFVASSQRKVTPAEFGVGVDLVVAGVYFGVSADELIDFLSGLVTIDFKRDDIR